MRVVIITQNEPFYVPIFFERFLLIARQKGITVVNIVVLQPFNESLIKIGKRMLNFYGPVNFVRQGFKFTNLYLRNLLHIAHCSVPALAERYRIPWRVERDINSTAFLEYIKKQQPDVILSIAATQIFKDKLISLPKWGCINVHTSKLPKYRGVMPTFWAMYHGDCTTGITVFKMDEKIDGGKIILQEEFPIGEKDTLDMLMRKTKAFEADLVLKSLELIQRGSCELKDYVGQGSYFSFPRKQDVRILKSKGKKLL